MGNLEKKLGEIKYLKQEWDIGSKDAYDYLKSQDELNAFRKRHEGQGALQFTNRQIANIADEFKRLVNHFLDSNYSVYADEEKYWVKENVVQEMVPTHKITYDKNDNVWICDYDQVFSLFFEHYYAFSKVITNQDLKVVAAFNSTLSNLLFDEIPFLYDLKETPRLVSEIISNEKLIVLGENTLEDKDTMSSDLADSSRSELENFESLRELNFGSLPFYPELNVYSRHEYKYLFGFSVGEKDDLYDRAVKELTLKNQETQRRIALNYLLHLPEDERNLENAYSKLEHHVHSGLKTVSKFEHLEAPQPIIEGAQNSLKKRIYLLKAVKKHGKWLEQMLSH